jgi:hypothetical protein
LLDVKSMAAETAANFFGIAAERPIHLQNFNVP